MSNICAAAALPADAVLVQIRQLVSAGNSADAAKAIPANICVPAEYNKTVQNPRKSIQSAVQNNPACQS